MLKILEFAVVMMFSMLAVAEGRVQIETEEKCEVVRANIFEETLKEPQSGVPYLDGKFLSLALRHDPHQIRAAQLKNLDRDLKMQISLSLGTKIVKSADLEKIDNVQVNIFQWSHSSAPHAWYQVVYYYKDDKVSGFVFVMNTSIVAARIIDGELFICDTMFRAR